MGRKRVAHSSRRLRRAKCASDAAQPQASHRMFGFAACTRGMLLDPRKRCKFDRSRGCLRELCALCELCVLLGFSLAVELNTEDTEAQRAGRRRAKKRALQGRSTLNLWPEPCGARIFCLESGPGVHCAQAKRAACAASPQPAGTLDDTDCQNEPGGHGKVAHLIWIRAWTQVWLPAPAPSAWTSGTRSAPASSPESRCPASR